MKRWVNGIGVVALAMTFVWMLLASAGTEKTVNSPDTSYTFDMTASKTVQKKGEIHLTITASKGYQIKPPSPLKIKLQPSKGVQLAKTKLGWDDAKVEKKKKVEVKTGYTLETSGTAQSTVQANIRFALCDDKGCYLKNVKHQVVIP